MLIADYISLIIWSAFDWLPNRVGTENNLGVKQWVKEICNNHMSENLYGIEIEEIGSEEGASVNGKKFL